MKMESNTENKTEKIYKRVKTSTVLQMEAVECGAASLAMVLGYFGCFIPLEKLRIDTGVSRDGVKASNIVKAARKYGLTTKGYRKEPQDLRKLKPPMIVHWNFNHFLVVEGFKKNKVYLNDPAAGSRIISLEEFDQSFTGVVIVFEKGEGFKKIGHKKSIITSLKKRLSSSKQELIFLILLGFLLVVPGLVIPVFSKIFVDNILIDKMTGWLKPLLFGMFLTFILRTIMESVKQYYLLRFETKLSLKTSAGFFWHILRLPVEFFSQRFAGEIGSRVMSNDTVANLIAVKLTDAAINLVMIVFYAALMFYYDSVLTLIGISAAVLNVLFLKYVSKVRKDGSRKFLQDEGKLNGVSMAGLQLIETLKAGGTESDFFSKWSGYQAKLINSKQKLGSVTELLSAVPIFLTGLTNILVLSIGGERVMDGYLTMGMLVAFQSLMSSFMKPVNNMVELGGVLQEVEGDMDRLDDVHNYEIDTRYEEDNINNNIKGKLSGSLEVKNISFGYSKLEDPLIENLSIKMNPGSRIALVGGTGSGKSTIAKIISGLYQPWDGEILFDNNTMSSIPSEVISDSLAIVDQDISMFEGTIKENITMWDNTISEHTMLQAAKDACIHDDISSRPGGYDSFVSEGGSNFSGGQKQRLEIARALVGNPSVLIMDEATSALDPLTEKIIDQNIRRRGCTCIIVAHRLSTIRDCDEIIVLKYGKIVQRGTHEQLRDKEGLYSELINAH